VIFVATSATLGPRVTPLEDSGTLKACQLLSFEERLGSEEIGTFPGIASNVTQSIGIVMQRKLWITLYFVRGRKRRTNS
jgi:hypothetical protein